MPTFFLTDLENSTRLWEEHGHIMGDTLTRHDAIVISAVTECGGEPIKHTGDGIFAVFEKGNPLRAAIEVQKRLAAEDWRPVSELRVRIAIHTGHAEKKGSDYFGPAVNRTARLLATGWGGQILVTSEAAQALSVAEGGSLRSLGAHLLKDLTEPVEVYELAHPELPLQDFPDLRSVSAHPNNLPAQSTPFIGRGKELYEIGRLLDRSDCRLLTLLGPGGIGKTRLALQVAAESIEAYPHGVYFVPLADAGNPGLLVPAIAKALRFSFYRSRSPEEQLLGYLQSKEMLLILDNFEHLLPAAGFISSMLAEAPRVQVLVTSRERLNLSSEWTFEVRGLQVPEGALLDIEHYSAVQLFAETARRMDPGFSLSGAEEKEAIRICQLLYGMPLAIELAASWIRALSCREIAEEISRGTDLLATTQQDVPERHRSMKSVFNHSWKLLSKPEQEGFARLSVFRGGFSRKGAEEVAGASLPLVLSLLNKSLLRRRPEGRYEAHELLRQFAEEKLRRSPAGSRGVEEACARFFARFLHERTNDLHGGRQKEASQEIEEEIENIRKQWNWILSNRDEALARVSLEALYLFFLMRGWFEEGQEAFGRAAAVFGPLTRLGASFLAHQGSCLVYLSRFAEARQLLLEALLVLKPEEDARETAFCHTTLGYLAYTIGDYAAARQYCKEGLALYRKSAHAVGMAEAAFYLAASAWQQGAYAEAQDLVDQALSARRQLNDWAGLGDCTNFKGMIAYGLGRFEESRQLFEEALALFQAMGQPNRVTEILSHLGNVSLALGSHEEARHQIEQSLAMSTEMGNRVWMATNFLQLGNLEYVLGRHEEASRFLKQSLELSTEVNNRWGTAQAFLGLGNVRLAAGNDQEAEVFFKKALKLAAEIGEVPSLLAGLLGMAKLLARRGEREKAYRLLAAAAEEPGFTVNHPVVPIEAKKEARLLLKELESSLPEQGRQKTNPRTPLVLVAQDLVGLTSDSDAPAARE